MFAKTRIGPNRSYVVQDSAGKLYGYSDEPFAVKSSIAYISASATSTVKTGPCEYAGYDCVSGSGTLTIYDGTSTSGTLILPQTNISSASPVNELIRSRSLSAGCHVVITGTVTVNILVE